MFEAFDHVGVLVRLVPEWAHVPRVRSATCTTASRSIGTRWKRSLNAAAILESAGFDGEVARRAPRERLLLGALLHDIGKGLPGDHSEAGAATAASLAERIGLSDHATTVLAWLVRNHLLLADTATRRDLSDELTITRFARAVGDSERLDLLYALTIGDSRATGPAAWNSSKAALVRELFTKTDELLEAGVVRLAPGDAASRRARGAHRSGGRRVPRLDARSRTPPRSGSRLWRVTAS